MSYYIYFITPEAESRFITFGKTSRLGSRWEAYRTTTPDPKIVGLIKCETQNDMNCLEREIKLHHFQDAKYRGEWLYHTLEVKAFYGQHTNIDIKATLLDAITIHREYQRVNQQHPEYREYLREYKQRPENKERHRERERERYQNDTEYRERRRKHSREYYQRPEVKERRREYEQRTEVKERKRERQRERYQRKKRQHSKDNGQLTF